MESLRENQMENARNKKQNNSIEMSDSFGGLINTVEMCEERISKLGEIAIQPSKIEMQRQ